MAFGTDGLTSAVNADSCLRRWYRLKSHQACISIMYFVSVTKIKVDIVEIDSNCADFRAFLHIIISYFAKSFVTLGSNIVILFLSTRTLGKFETFMAGS